MTEDDKALSYSRRSLGRNEMTSKKLSPLRLKDISTGRQEERAAIVAWLGGINHYVAKSLADQIEAGEHLK